MHDLQEVLQASGPGLDAGLLSPGGICVTPDGSVLFGDAGNLRRLRSDGRIEWLGGSLLGGDTGDGQPVARARFGSLLSLACDDRGRLFLADFTNGKIRILTPDGLMATVTGATSPNHAASSVTGHRSLTAPLRFDGPRGVAVNGRGELLIAEFGSGRLTQIAPGGPPRILVRRSQFRGPLTAFRPVSSAWGPDGRPYLLDSTTRTVYRVETTGDLRRIAGLGLGGQSRGGRPRNEASGPATAIALRRPTSIAFDRVGRLLIADTGSHRIFEVDRNGTGRVIVGTGFAGYSGDGGPATEAMLDNPFAVVRDRRGRTFISDQGNQKIRMVDRDGRIFTVAGGEKLSLPH